MSRLSKLIVEGDRHIQSKQPFLKAHRAYNEWLLSHELNTQENIWFSEGDFLNRSTPDPWEYAVAMEFLENAKFGRKIIQAGNHEYSRAKDRYSLHPFEELDDVEVIYEETEMTLGSTEILILPYYYPHLRKDVGRMEEYYPTLTGEYDFIFGHLYFMDTYGSYCDISSLKGRKIIGHDHDARKAKITGTEEYAEYIGCPMPTSYTQRGQQGRLLVIDLETGTAEYIKIPMFLDYAEVTYPDPLPETEAQFTIWSVKDVPDKQVAIDHYQKQDPDFAYREILRKKDTPSSVKKADDGEDNVWSIKDWMQKFVEDKEKSDRVREIVDGKLAKTS